MAKTEASQVQQNAFPFAPMWAEQLAQMESMTAELEKTEAEAIRRGTEAANEAARLYVESLQYASRLAKEWRKMALSSARAMPGTTVQG